MRKEMAAVELPDVYRTANARVALERMGKRKDNGLLDRRPAGAICVALARGKNREDAASAAAVRDAESLPSLAVRGPRGGEQGIKGIDRDDTTGELARRERIQVMVALMRE